MNYASFSFYIKVRLWVKPRNLNNCRNRNCLNYFAKKLKKCKIAKGLADVKTL